ncbi:MAG: IPT/TIG domain-containing protein [Bacteroidota bacterium]
MMYRTILLFVLFALLLAACQDAGDPVIPADNTPVPVVTSIAPDSGKAGDTITVRGKNFGATPTGNSVRFGSIGGSVVLWNDSTVLTTVPASLAGGSIQLSVVRGTKISNTTAFTVLSSVSAISFAGDVRPLITAYGCSGCHPGNGNFSVATHATIITRVTIGNGDGSLLVRKLRGQAGARMPVGGPFMTATEIQKFVDWINQGALNN